MGVYFHPPTPADICVIELHKLQHLFEQMLRFQNKISCIGKYFLNLLFCDIHKFPIITVLTKFKCLPQVLSIRNQKRRVRVVILKARRKGISTWVSGRFFWKTTTNRNRYSMIVTHEPEATDFVFKMHKRFQDNPPEWFRPTERYNNKKMLEFNNDAGTGLDSAIRVGTAAKEDFGSSQLIHYLHLSEVPKWPRHVTTNLILSLLQCVPDTDDSEIFLESTAKGVGGEFYTRYWGSRYRIEFYLGEDGKPALRETINDEASEDNIYTSVFIPWFVFSEYQKEPAPNFQRTEEEEQIARLHNLTDRHLAWRRWAIENMSRSGTYQEKLLLFNQAYDLSSDAG